MIFFIYYLLYIMEVDKDEINLETLFTGNIQNPFTYNLNLKESSLGNCSVLFEEIKQIFVQGLLYNTDNSNILETDGKKTLLIDKIPNKDINIIKQYMLSMGIELTHKQYDDEDKDYYIRGLLYELQHKYSDKVNMKVEMDWIKQLISKVHITIDEKVVKEVNAVIRKHKEVNFFLNLFKPENIEECYLSYYKQDEPTILNIIYFKGANIADYQYKHKYATPFTKHVR